MGRRGQEIDETMKKYKRHVISGGLCKYEWSDDLPGPKTSSQSTCLTTCLPECLPPPLWNSFRLKNILINSGVSPSATSIDRFLIIILIDVLFFIISFVQLGEDTTVPVNKEAGM